MIDSRLEKIAKEILRIETLETRKRDCLDFHEVSVWGLHEALRVAYELGKKVGSKEDQLYVSRNDGRKVKVSIPPNEDE